MNGPANFRNASSKPVGVRLALSRNELFVGLVALGFCNGASETIAQQWRAMGPLAAVFDTFSISIIVWAALVIGLALLVRDRTASIGRLDLAVVALALLAFIVPVPSLSWLGIDVIALYLLRTSPTSTATARAAAILLAMTIPMFWARLLMAAFGNFILEMDAMLVSSVLGTARSGNVVSFADGSGSMWFAPSCSSFTNVSLAILAAALFVKGSGQAWSQRTLLFTVVTCAAVVAINVVRISLIGLHPDQFELIHGPVGSTVAGWLTTAAILGLCAYGIGRNAPPVAA